MNHRRRALRLGLAAFALAAAASMPVSASALATGHTGSGRPALAQVGTRLYVGWTGSTGTAASKGLNLGWSLDQGKTVTKIANSETAPQNEGPALDGDATGVYLAWPSGKASNTLTAAYFNGTALTCRTSFTGIVTPHSPALASDASGVRYLAWTDAAGHLNVAQLDSSACATSNTMTLANRVTLPDVSAAGPSLVYDSSGSSNLGLVVTWLGTSAAHTVNVASYVGTTTLTKRSQVTSPTGATGSPSIISEPSDLYLVFRGTNGDMFLAYSEGCSPSCFQASDSGVASQSDIGIAPNGGIFKYTYFDLAGHLNITTY